MGDSRRRIERQLQDAIGSLGKAKVEPNRLGGLSYRVICQTCKQGAANWSTWRNRTAADVVYPNSFGACLSRWEKHIQHAHRH